MAAAVGKPIPWAGHGNGVAHMGYGETCFARKKHVFGGKKEYLLALQLPSLAGHGFLAGTVSCAVLTGTQRARVSTGQPGPRPTVRAAQLLRWWEGARAAAVGPGGSEALREGAEDSREMLESLYLRLGLEPVSMCAKALSRVRLCDPTDHSPPGSSVHDILQARILEWIAMPSSRESPEPNPSSRIEPETQSPSLAGWFFTTGTARETLNPCSGTQAEPKP